MARSTSVILGDHFDEFVNDQISRGGFQSISEVICAGLLKLEEDEIKSQWLNEQLRSGENSPVIEGFQGNYYISGRRQP